jgi:hypothetical protein
MFPVSSPLVPPWVRRLLSPKLPGHWQVVVWDRHPRLHEPAFSVEPPWSRLQFTPADFSAVNQPGIA